MASRSKRRATAKVFVTGRSQAVRIPKEFRFASDEVTIERVGKSVMLTARPRTWRDFFVRAPRIGDDFPDAIGDLPVQKRKKL